jgi:hypothetical protein
MGAQVRAVPFGANLGTGTVQSDSYTVCELIRFRERMEKSKAGKTPPKRTW